MNEELHKRTVPACSKEPSPRVPKKRIILILCLSLAILVILGAVWVHYAYWHPRQDILTFRSTNVSYPGIMFNSYEGCGLFEIPPVLWDQMEDFNERVGAFVHETELEYGDSLVLDYRLEHDESGTDVLFNGQGTKEDGTVAEVNESLHFDIVIRKDAHWN